MSTTIKSKSTSLSTEYLELQELMEAIVTTAKMLDFTEAYMSYSYNDSCSLKLLKSPLLITVFLCETSIPNQPLMRIYKRGIQGVSYTEESQELKIQKLQEVLQWI